MAKTEVKFTSLSGEAAIPAGTDASVAAKGTVQVCTPAGQVFVSHDSVTGMMLVVVRGEKSTTAVKFNEKAVV
ncbi:hypothetical protein LCGC14_2760110 [marine sediment metagenome]|uniref:Uncharacterized protein n=1 Tax=marine sediment metagenome TaxID=412755 RepID=A0A0F8YZ93_9ZZZZ